jgi:hypothetical protein
MKNPNELLTKGECQRLIDLAIKQHNRNAALISLTLGSIALIGYVDGMLRIIERVNQ